jgi:aryl-alcohol dehydrogenase-like predicted oxidoreductase
MMTWHHDPLNFKLKSADASPGLSQCSMASLVRHQMKASKLQHSLWSSPVVHVWPMIAHSCVALAVPGQVDSENIRAAIDGSLLRLGTDYLDLVFLHWPDRYVYEGLA